MGDGYICVNALICGHVGCCDSLKVNTLLNALTPLIINCQVIPSLVKSGEIGMSTRHLFN